MNDFLFPASRLVKEAREHPGGWSQYICMHITSSKTRTTSVERWHPYPSLVPSLSHLHHDLIAGWVQRQGGRPGRYGHMCWHYMCITGVYTVEVSIVCLLHSYTAIWDGVVCTNTTCGFRCGQYVASPVMQSMGMGSRSTSCSIFLLQTR